MIICYPPRCNTGNVNSFVGSPVENSNCTVRSVSNEYAAFHEYGSLGYLNGAAYIGFQGPSFHLRHNVGFSQGFHPCSFYGVFFLLCK